MASLAALQKTFEFVSESEYSSFYRDRFGARHVQSWHDWESLPFLTKADIQRVPYRERLYVPYEELYRMHQTSGTTGAGPTILPRTRVPYDESIAPHFDPRCYMGFMYPHSGYEMFTAPSARFIAGDTARLAQSAALAAEAGIDGIAAASASLVIELAGPLGERYDLNEVRHVLLQGDICTTLQRRAIERLYPSARIAMIYLCAEMQGIAAFPAGKDDPAALAASEHVHVELIDEVGHAIADCGVEGEIVISAVRPGMALPLLRYRPGDRGIFLERSENRTAFKVTGRVQNDRLRLAAGQITLRELERAIERTVSEAVIDFVAYLDEAGDPPLPSLSIALEGDALAAQELERLARMLERELRIAPERSYADGIARGVCGPIACRMMNAQEPQPQKRQRLVDLRER